ncbi:30S ribosomal protein S18 [Hordeum vulgare]|uniref:Small ribosomal subunit protein bS18c n=1 Tax=Hordeum vulgare subsp. vulgare TaxID=112509 RepID=F2CVM4_HORVV|nr:uncharacterized protein LOC123433113 [Hordeum vulgare subsp. vulgare]KAE8767133.1 30S ribosomal protein S18 [Hordeum vulgare]KAI5016773.1 hypothetical protein ZWY2020_006624 [Hordeum vulgare]BAJ86895.1 predicted protein [Hordeum vulgare subsp. vulgare]BAK07618.1 predicted protein [Hordeum vulgare subsp. vulgare]
MASSALRRSLPRRLLTSHPSSAAASLFRRSFLSGEGAVESADDFEKRMFEPSSDDKAFFGKLDGVGNSFGRRGTGFGMSAFGRPQFGESSNGGSMDVFDSSNDGMNEKLDDAARTFHMTDEVDEDDYDFRPDVNYRRGSTYSVKDLDLTKPAAPRNPPRPQFETSTKEVLRKADFRNVRFLSNFLTEAGIIIKRNQTKISAKAQRKVAREIKTARALGLMPFTTMGKRPFMFGRSAEEDASEEEYGYGFVEKDAGPEDPVADAVPDVEAV